MRRLLRALRLRIVVSCFLLGTSALGNVWPIRPRRGYGTAPCVKIAVRRSWCFALPAKIKIGVLRVTVGPMALVARNGLKRLPLARSDDEIRMFVAHERL